MKRLVCRAFGALEVEEQPDPVAGPGEVLVAVQAANVSYVDRLIVGGGYQVRPPLPFTPGGVAAGEVLAVGEGVDGPAVGQRVVALLTSFGAWASAVVVPAWAAVPLPPGLSAEVAAGVVEAYGTAAFALHVRGRLGPAERVVVLGAGGAVGAAAVATAVADGAEVVAVTSDPDHWSGAGPTVTVADRRPPDFDLRSVLRSVCPDGVDVVVDPVGGPLALPCLKSLRSNGRYLVVGFASGEIPSLPANHVLLRNRCVVGVEWRTAILEDPGSLRTLLEGVLQRTARGLLTPSAPMRSTFAQLAAGEVPVPRSGLVRTVVTPG